MAKRKGIMAVVGLVALGTAANACSAQTLNNQGSHEQSLDQAYAIVDFQTPRSGRQIAEALQRHLARPDVAVVARSQAVAVVPPTPGRFTLVDPAAPGGFGLEGPAIRAPAGWLHPVRTVACDGASWRADVTPSRPARIEQRYTLCLFPYRDGRRQGHRLTVYASRILRGDPAVAIAPPVDAETPAAFMHGAVQAVERATRARGVWTEHRTASQDRPFTQDDDAWSAQTH